jgi:TonB family C-terminal domain
LAAQRRHQAGTVWLIVRVTANGRAARVELTRSSGFPLLDEAAMAAVRRWEFEPARVGAQAVASTIEIPVHFKLRR